MSGGVVERSRLLAQLTDDLETVKAEMEERGEKFSFEKTQQTNKQRGEKKITVSRELDD